MISRQEAAKLLDTTCQTITNWVDEGILKGHMISSRLMVDKETITKYFDNFLQLAQTEDRVRQKQARLSSEESLLDKEIEDISKSKVLLTTGMPKWLITEVYAAVLCAAGESVLSERERSLLMQLNCGDSITTLSVRFSITRERVLQIVHKAFRKMYVMRTFSDIRKERDSLYEDNQHQAAYIEILTKQIEKFRNNPSDKELEDRLLSMVGGKDRVKDLTEILSTRLVDTGLSLRALHCLKSGHIETVADLAKSNKGDLLKLRNFGRHTLSEVERFLDKYHLEFGMDVENILTVAARII